MNRLVEKVVNKLTNPKDKKEFNKALIYAGDIISSYKMKGFTSCIYPEIDKEKYTKKDIENLKKILLQRLQQKPHSSYAISILGALGKLADKSLKKIYIDYLIMYAREAIKYDSNINSVTIALSDIGEKIIKGSSQGVYNFDKNIKQAMDYLKKVGKFDLIFDKWHDYDKRKVKKKRESKT